MRERKMSLEQSSSNEVKYSQFQTQHQEQSLKIKALCKSKHDIDLLNFGVEFAMDDV